ncbi:hypothetical protein EVAR_69386_1, partial [Eumeta japonica]
IEPCEDILAAEWTSSTGQRPPFIRIQIRSRTFRCCQCYRAPQTGCSQEEFNCPSRTPHSRYMGLTGIPDSSARYREILYIHYTYDDIVLEKDTASRFDAKKKISRLHL